MSQVLQTRIVERIQREGPLPFAEYMRMALYEPGLGYYVSGPAKMGWEGDYYTSTDVSPFFGHCMGRQLYQMWQALQQPASFVVVEQGAGKGLLAQGVRSWAEKQEGDFAAALQYYTVDIHAGQDALQMEELMLPDSDQPLKPAVLLSNELVDAFPVHVVEKYEGQLYEVYVDVVDERLYERLGGFSDGAIADYIERYKVAWRDFEDGWRGEVNLAALRWMARTAQVVTGGNEKRRRRGFVLAIDYGDVASKLYTAFRPRGTLACYSRHQLNERPLAFPGEQDITAHVNFSALIDEGRRQGLRLQALMTQREWLTSQGLYEELEAVRQERFQVMDTDRASDAGQVALLEWYNLRQQAMALTARGGMGDFKVLIMKR